jgi:hypothetical protein
MDDIEELLQNAATIHLAAIKVSVSGAMKFARFSAEQCADRSLQMRVRRHLKKADKSPSPSSILDATPSSESTASTLSSCSTGSRKRKADLVSVLMSGIKRELDTDFQAKLLPEKKPKQSRQTSKQKHEADA